MHLAHERFAASEHRDSTMEAFPSSRLLWSFLATLFSPRPDAGCKTTVPESPGTVFVFT